MNRIAYYIPYRTRGIQNQVLKEPDHPNKGRITLPFTSKKKIKNSVKAHDVFQVNSNHGLLNPFTLKEATEILPRPWNQVSFDYKRV